MKRVLLAGVILLAGCFVIAGAQSARGAVTASSPRAAAAATPTAQPSPTPTTASPTEAPTTASPTAAPSTASTVPSPTPTSTSTSTGGLGANLIWLWFVLGALVLLGIILLATRSPGRSRPSAAPARPPAETANWHSRAVMCMPRARPSTVRCTRPNGWTRPAKRPASTGPTCAAARMTLPSRCTRCARPLLLSTAAFRWRMPSSRCGLSVTRWTPSVPPGTPATAARGPALPAVGS